MCMPKASGGGSSTAVLEQLNQVGNNVSLSNEKVASTTGEKTGKKRTVSSLRVPIKGKNDTSTTGVNTTDTTTGLNIPV